MAHLKVAWKAYQVKRGMDKMAQAKIDAERELAGLPPLRPWWKDCIINTFTWTRETCFKALCPCCIYDRRRHKWKKKAANTCLSRLCIDGTYENDLFKSFLGKGRTFLLAYCFVLIVNGPMHNFSHNIQVMSQSAACGQLMAENATKEILAEAMQPVKGILAPIRQALRGLTQAADRLRKAFQAMKQLFQNIVDAIKRLFKWLADMVNICNHNMGRPYRQCKKVFEIVVKKCRENAIANAFGLCSLADKFSVVCNIARVGEFLCKLTELVQQLIVKKVQTSVQTAVQNVYEMFYFNVTLIHHLNYTITQSKTSKEIQRDIMNEIKSWVKPFESMMDFSSFAIAFMLLWLFIKAMLYRRNYLTKDKFDNFYVTFNLRDIDERRQEMERETILPLNWKESSKYITTWSPRLAKPEKKKLVRGLIMLAGSFMHASFYMYCDMGLYTLLDLIRTHAELKTHSEVPHTIGLHVQGNGAFADMYRMLISTFDPIGRIGLEIDTTPCLPNPSPVNPYIYKEILFIWATCILLVLLEAYGLRLRHVIVGCYYEKREKERAIWLYNHILQQRGGFLKFLRRQLRRKYEKEEAIEKISIRSRLASQYPILGKVFKYFGYERKYCLCCGQPGKPDDMDHFKHCSTSDCKAIYCQDCFTDINNMCTVCMNPVDYCDFSDFSEERDSSEEEVKLKSKMDVLERQDGSETDSLNSSDYDYQNREDDTDTSEAFEQPSRKASATASRTRSGSRRDLVTMAIYHSDRVDEEESDSDEEVYGPFVSVREPRALSIQRVNDRGFQPSADGLNTRKYSGVHDASYNDVPDQAFYSSSATQHTQGYKSISQEHLRAGFRKEIEEHHQISRQHQMAGLMMGQINTHMGTYESNKSTTGANMYSTDEINQQTNAYETDDWHFNSGVNMNEYGTDNFNNPASRGPYGNDNLGATTDFYEADDEYCDETEGVDDEIVSRLPLLPDE
ncbi:DC-STAMP domain-containing protein 2 isoform X2 [Lingula anatina]|uniref:DC-STAMP domain-containing protein 2 isoform X2 n=1 Tax=Lingula anatina TaxID=7574 RepID=A0A1S3HSN3_LINAN|nr:DC-STAMP domain-containing protein 2 isoform X2 [Lingula anatina]|eukprot:XP_013388561.1 DC-STAMP domain-containing protein 2 isoform X2 [Lingula anatina]